MPETFLQKLNKPYHPHSFIPAWLLIILLVTVLINLSRLFTTDINLDTPIDFKPFYVGQHLLLEGKNPYPDSILKAGWKEIVEEEQIISNRQPGLPLTFLLYPPHALGMFSFLSTIPYKIAYVLWYLSLPFMLAIMAFFIAKLYPGRNSKILFTDVFLLSLAFKGTISAMLVGQPTFICLAICFAGLYFIKTERKILGGILLGLGTFKITLVMPFVLYILYRKQYKALFASAITGIILIGGTFLLVNDIQVFQSFFANVEAQRAWIFERSRPDYPFNYEMITLTEIGMLAEFLSIGANRFITWLNILLAVPVISFLYLQNKRQALSGAYLFVVLGLLMLLTTYHLFYDCLLLLPLYFLWPRLTTIQRWVVLSGFAIWMIPLNGILYRYSHPAFMDIFFFSLPLSLLLVLIALLWKPVHATNEAETEF